MTIDWLDVWFRLESGSLRIKGCNVQQSWEENKKQIEQFVNEQIEAQEEQYPELCGLPHPPASLCEAKRGGVPPADAIMEKKIIEAARKASRSGSAADLAEYMKLRRERLG